MKNISKYLGAALLLLFSSCSKTQDGPTYTPNKDDAKEIHFIQTSIEKEFAQDAREGSVDVPIARSGNRGSYTVTLTNKGADAAMFKVPETVTFADGEYSVTIPVEVDLKSLKMGSNYKTSLLISARDASLGSGGAQVSQYSDKLTISVAYELSWEPYMRTTAAGEKVQQLATYHYSLYYNGRDGGLAVEKAVGANIFRVKDWASGVTFRFVLHDDNTCTVPAQSIGYFNSVYNEYVYVADMAVYTGNDAAYNSYPCTFDGKSTFTFYLIYYVSGGYFAQGQEKLVFDADVDTTPVVDIAFKGVETTTNGFRAPRLAFSPNAYTKFYKASVVAGDITTDPARQAEVLKGLAEDKLETVVPIVTLFTEDESVWNVPRGNYTAVALAYDSKDAPAKLYTERFTCDPDNEYAVKVHDFEWFASDKINPSYSPYTSLFWSMKASNIKKMQYLCMKSDFVDYVTTQLGMTLEELTFANGNVMEEELIAEINSDEGRLTVFSPMDEGTEYTLAVVMTNEFGDTKFVSSKATTFGHFAADFDRTKRMEDFLGAFKVSATSTVGSAKTAINYRMDIARVSDTELTITGASDMRDYAPALRAYYDKELHMVIVEPQAAGMYDSKYTMFGLSNGLSIFWGANSMAIGYIGDTLYWAASPYAEDKVNSYMFLLFSSPQATGSSYLREYVGEKSYSNISMVPLKLAPSKAAAIAAAPNAVAMFVGDRYIFHHLMSGSVASAAGSTRKSSFVSDYSKPTAGKVMRRDLRFHPDSRE